MVPFRRVYNKTVQKGSLINFQYLFYKHDPNPLVLVTSIYSDGKIAGINLHYLTYVYVRNLVKRFCNDRTFNYYKIKGDRYLYKSFRTYKRAGVKNLHMMDCDILNNVLKTVRTFKFTPNELQAIQNSIRQQVKDIQNPSAMDLVGKMQSMLTPHQHSMFNQDQRLGPNLGQENQIL